MTPSPFARLGLAVLALMVGFMGWYAYIIHKATGPLPPAMPTPTVPLPSRAAEGGGPHRPPSNL